jgi:hypothetical protein
VTRLTTTIHQNRLRFYEEAKHVTSNSRFMDHFSNISWSRVMLLAPGYLEPSPIINVYTVIVVTVATERI